jgi:hypothetical protein
MVRAVQYRYNLAGRYLYAKLTFNTAGSWQIPAIDGCLLQYNGWSYNYRYPARWCENSSINSDARWFACTQGCAIVFNGPVVVS